MTLTFYGTDTASATLSTANQLLANVAGGSASGKDHLVGTATGWGEITSQPNASAWAALGAIGAPTGKGWLRDTTEAEGLQLAAGNFQPILRGVFNAATASATADLVVRAYIRSSGGVYTLIGSITLAAQSLTTTTTTYTWVAASFGQSPTFAPGDKIYIDVWGHITANPNTNAAATFRFNDGVGTSLGYAQNSYLSQGYTFPPATSTANGAMSASAPTFVFPSITTTANGAMLASQPTVAYFTAITAEADGLLSATQPQATTFAATLVTANGSMTATVPGVGNFAPVYPSVLGGLTAGRPTRTIAIPSAGYLKEQYVKVYSPTRVFIDVWRDAPLVGSSGFQAPKSGVNVVASQITITLPRSFDNFDEAGDGLGRGTVSAGNIVQIWIVDNASIPDGHLIFQGTIDGYEGSIDAQNNEQVIVTITPFDAVLGDVKFIGTQTFGTAGVSATYVDPVAMFNWPYQNINSITGKPYTYPLTLATTNPVVSGSPYSAQFKNEAVVAWQETVRTLAPSGWFWLVNSDLTVTFRMILPTAVHTFVIGRHIGIPVFQKNYQNLKNDIYVQGTGVTSRATGSDYSSYGLRGFVVVEPRIIDQVTCDRYAQAILAQLDRVDYRSTITIIDIRGEGTGAGYDIDIINVGDTCRLENPYRNQFSSQWDSFTWDEDDWDFAPGAQINQVVTIAANTYGFDHVDLELSTLQPSQDRFLTDLAQKFEQSQFS